MGRRPEGACNASSFGHELEPRFCVVAVPCCQEGGSRALGEGIRPVAWSRWAQPHSSVGFFSSLQSCAGGPRGLLHRQRSSAQRNMGGSFRRRRCHNISQRRRTDDRCWRYAIPTMPIARGQAGALIPTADPTWWAGIVASLITSGALALKRCQHGGGSSASRWSDSRAAEVRPALVCERRLPPTSRTTFLGKHRGGTRVSNPGRPVHAATADWSVRTCARAGLRPSSAPLSSPPPTIAVAIDLVRAAAVIAQCRVSAPMA